MIYWINGYWIFYLGFKSAQEEAFDSVQHLSKQLLYEGYFIHGLLKGSKKKDSMGLWFRYMFHVLLLNNHDSIDANFRLAHINEFEIN